MIRKNSIKSAIGFWTMILLNSLFCGQVAAQLDTFNIAFCDKMHFDEIVRMSIEVKGKTIVLPRIDKNTFVNPLKYVSKNDNSCVLVVELRKSIFRLHHLSAFMIFPKWELCLPQRKKYKKNKEYSYYNYYNGGYGILQPLRYIKDDSTGKAILSSK